MPSVSGSAFNVVVLVIVLDDKDEHDDEDGESFFAKHPGFCSNVGDLGGVLRCPFFASWVT